MIGADRLDRAGRLYLRLIPFVGVGVLLWALLDLLLHPPAPSWLALAALTVLTGSFTVKIPGLVARLSVSEPFVFAATLWFGPSVGAVTAALDALIMSLWLMPTLKTAHRVAFNVSVLVISIWLASQGFFLLAGIDAHAPRYDSLAQFVVPLYLFTACCFLLNSGLVAVALGFERQLSAFRIWREQFLWLSLNYFGGASLAALLVVYAKSIDWAVVGIIVPLLAISYLTFRTTLGRLDDADTHLRELNHLYLSTIETLAMAVDAKDQVTHGHIRRVQRYALGLASQLGVTDANLLKAIEAAALLHDMGKLAIPEHILNKPGLLSPPEFEKMKLHAGIGADILSSIQFPYPVVPIVRHHHENWDGSGYPDHLRATAIPLGARILSVVDCYDALTSDRPYRSQLSSRDALAVVMERRGSMYDPVIVDTFARSLDKLERSILDLGPESPALRQIAELNRPDDGARIPTSAISLASDWTPEAPPERDSLSLAEAAFKLALARLPVQGLSLSSVTSDGAALSVTGVAGLVEKNLLGTQTELGKKTAGWVAANRSPAINSPAVLDLGRNSEHGGLRCSLVVPIICDDVLLGVMSLYSQELRAFTEKHVSDAFALAACLSVTLVKRRLLSDTADLAPSMTAQGLARDRWPLGLIVVKFSVSRDADPLIDEVRSVLESCVRVDDAVIQLDNGVYALLLGCNDHATTAIVVTRLNALLAEVGAAATISWKAVAHRSDAQSASTSALTRKSEIGSKAEDRRLIH